MFQQFMQMGAPAAIALVGMTLALGGVAIALIIRGQAEAAGARKYDLDKMQVLDTARIIEHKRSHGDE